MLPQVAASAHVAGRDFAKTVMVWIGGHLAMVVLPLPAIALRDSIMARLRTSAVIFFIDYSSLSILSFSLWFNFIYPDRRVSNP